MAPPSAGQRRTSRSRLSSNLATLFDGNAGLIHAETWLKDLALDAEQNRGGRPEILFNTIISALKRVLPDVDNVAVRDKRVWVTRRSTGEVPFAALSDGYLTTMGWLIDLIARWVDRAERRGEKVEAGFTETMEGLVLIDEIDLHLHPRWQCTVISDLRETFPRMSFVVTTHNPLTLLGARPGEIFVLRRARGGGDVAGPVAVRQVDLPKGARADQVLTGPWFGLPSTLDKETQALLDEHRRLLRNREGESDERLRAIEEELRERLGTFADTSLDRLALNVAAQLMDEDYRELTPDERESIQREVKERTRRENASSRGEN
ncbi:MAG: AAA family ATPase [Minicystis sp.]